MTDTAESIERKAEDWNVWRFLTWLRGSDLCSLFSIRRILPSSYLKIQEDGKVDRAKNKEQRTE